MSNSSLQKLISGNSDLVQILRDEFPDLFSKRYVERTKACKNRLTNDLTRAKSASLKDPPSEFETLPELIKVSRQEDILLSPSSSLLLQTHLVLSRHDILTGDRLLVLPAEFLASRSALGKEYFIIECDHSIFGMIYALYNSHMFAANGRYFSNKFLAPKMGGAGHRQAGTLDLFPFPLNTEIANKLEDCGQSLYEADKKAIQLSQAKKAKDLRNPNLNPTSGVLMKQIDQYIDSLYDFSGCPTGFDQRQWALLKLYAQKTHFLDSLKLL